ncbi:hypothetical protein EDC01DRAFT_636683 [Geopyxis carbonaria]|nr:hypothetical protein EDC01DRAFT_636683 [Geopyxis carbonaria]
MAPIVHIVLFQFKANVAPEVVKATCDKMLSLKTACLHPTLNTPYIKSAIGGKDNSPEKFQGGLTHGFVMEFENEDDRLYYVQTDPAHKAFTTSIESVVEKATVLDFSPGVFK